MSLRPASANLRFLLRFALVYGALAVLIFGALWGERQVHFTTDDNIGAISLIKRNLPGGYNGWWTDTALLGFGGPVIPSLSSLLIWLVPLPVFIDTIHLFDFTVGSFFLALFLRGRGCRDLAAILGGVIAYWLGTNLTLSYAGHNAKYGVLLFAAVFLWLADQAAQRNRVAWWVLAGGALGMMFAEQADVALFTAIILGPYVLYAVWREAGKLAWRRLVPALAALLPISFAVAFFALLGGYQIAVKGVAVQQEQTDPREKWEYTTQWSWPPDECIDFVAPGYMGWRSGEPDGPYWGRMGRSAEWAQTGQGFMNFKLENMYLGAIPLALALLAAAAAWMALRGRWRAARQASPFPCDVLFWSVMAVLALLLSFGKFFPLYALFYKLPLVNAIRNPNKFLMAFQIVIGILAAYGLETLLRRKDPAPTPAPAATSPQPQPGRHP